MGITDYLSPSGDGEELFMAMLSSAAFAAASQAHAFGKLFPFKVLPPKSSVDVIRDRLAAMRAAVVSPFARIVETQQTIFTSPVEALMRDKIHFMQTIQGGAK
jgi:hypothetical protein